MPFLLQHTLLFIYPFTTSPILLTANHADDADYYLTYQKYQVID